jgi:hypothetical protein
VVVAAVDCSRNILHGENPEATGFSKQGLFFWAEPESANADGYALASTARTMFDLTAFVDRNVVGFDGTIPPRLRDVMGMVFACTFLKSCHAPGERRGRNARLRRFKLSRGPWWRDFSFPPPHISPVAWDVESHQTALSSECSVPVEG